MELFNKKKLNKSGFVLVEVIVGIVVTSIIILTFTRGIFTAITLSQLNRDNLLAQLYISESVEIMRELESSDWSLTWSLVSPGNCSITSVCHFIDTASTWDFIAGDETLDTKFIRSFYMSDVYRDSNYEIATTGVLDTKTIKVTHQISWMSIRGPKNLVADTFIYNYE